MSITIMSQVWANAPYEGGALLVLLALADWANDQARCWPSVPAIAKKARINERQVYNILRQMKADGIITAEPGGGRGKGSQYQINTAMIAGFKGPQTLQSDAPKPCNPVQKNPAICDNPPDPLIGRTVKEPSKEPPRKTAGMFAIRKAAQSVCLACTFAGREIENAIAEAITTALGHPDCDKTPEQLGQFMARRWGEYTADAGLLRYQLTPAKFFQGAHWLASASWPYDQQQLRKYREANVGVYRG